MTNFTTRRTFLVPSFDLDAKEIEKMDRFLLILEKSGVDRFFPFIDERSLEKRRKTTLFLPQSFCHHTIWLRI